MDKDLDALLGVGTDGASGDVRRERGSHPKGWQPSIEFDGNSGTATLPPSEGVPNFDDFLIEQGFDPAEYRVVGAPRTSRWQTYYGDWLCSYRFNFEKIGSAAAEVDLEAIIKAAKGAKTKPLTAALNERAYFIQITDLQAGQADGDGVQGMVDRALQIPALVAADLKLLKKAGTPATSIFVPVTGDLVEGISGWYEMQTFSVSLDRREQTKLVRRMLSQIIIELASHGLPVHVAVVPGNHGENRQNGKAYTTLGDNDDVAVVEQIAEAFKMTDKMQHVTFSFPANNRLSLTVEVMGWVVALTHGHLARSGSSPTQKVANWFKTMAGIKDPVGDAEILFVGHYHHLILTQLIGDVVMIMGGALCDASDWFTQSYGLVSDPCIVKGTITADKKIENFMPYFWDRSRPQSTLIGSENVT
jgi:predicted phosphodiesterase